ncbi:MAG: hypothetical protein IT445_13695 [Phycisphaeraceae bacterium]|nr:hypothetical protein [Phycisphaeraceae bacterium]
MNLSRIILSTWISLCFVTAGQGQTTLLNGFEVPGAIVNHLPKSTGLYLGSPSIVVMPDGSYVVSHDLFGPNSTQPTVGQSSVFRSTDGGQTWTHQSDVSGAFWSMLFEYEGDLYFTGPYAGPGNWVIRKSTDYGQTWTTPTNSTNGLLVTGSFGASPSRIEIFGGRIWAPVNAGPRAISAPVGSDLLNAANWTLSEAVPEEFEWFNENIVWTEAQVVASPQTGLVMMPKIRDHAVTTLLRANPATGQLTFDDQNDFVDLPGAEKKFGATYDPVSQKFYVLSNAVLPEEASLGLPNTIRTTAAIITSKDLYHWDVEKLFLYTPNVTTEAFQYLNFAIDSDDLAVISRTAYADGLGGAHNYHDSNMITFHRVEDFRNVTSKQVLVADTLHNQVLRYEVTQTDFWAPLGKFELGSTFAGAALTKPLGLAQDAAGNVYVGEQDDGGRILRFDAMGNFLDVIATEGIDFTGRPEALTMGPDGNLYMSVAFGTTGSDKIYKIDLIDDSISLFVDTNFVGGTLDNPRGIAFGSDGNLYVADRQNGVVRKFSGVNGSFLGNLFTAVQPEALTWDQLQQKFLASTRNGSDTDLHLLALNGSSSKLYDPADIGPTLGIIDIDGDIYWTDYNNDRIYKLKGLNQKVSSVSSRLDGPGQLLHLALAPAGERAWLMSGSADWSELTNWFYWGRPDTNYEVAFFGTSANAASTITQNKALTLKGLRFRNTNAYTIAGTGSLTIEADIGHGVIDVQLGMHEIQNNLLLNRDTDATLGFGTLTLSGQVDLNGHTLYITGPGTINVTGTLLMNDGALGFTLAGSTIPSLNVAGHLSLDGSLVLLLAPGFTPQYGDTFNILGAAILTGEFDAIDGVIVDEDTALAVRHYVNSVTVTIALPGDANLDGVINLSDLQILGDHWQSSTANWVDADFNGDRMVNLADLQVLGDHWNASVGDFAALTADIPEPTVAMVFGPMAGVFLMRRR